jgi:hypothetical protein
LGCGKPHGLTPLRYSTEYPIAIANRIGVSKSNCYISLCEDFGPKKFFTKELDPEALDAIGLTGCFALDRRSCLIGGNVRYQPRSNNQALE